MFEDRFYFARGPHGEVYRGYYGRCRVNMWAWMFHVEPMRPGHVYIHRTIAFMLTTDDGGSVFIRPLNPGWGSYDYPARNSVLRQYDLHSYAWDGRKYRATRLGKHDRDREETVRFIMNSRNDHLRAFGSKLRRFPMNRMSLNSAYRYQDDPVYQRVCLSGMDEYAPMPIERRAA